MPKVLFVIPSSLSKKDSVEGSTSSRVWPPLSFLNSCAVLRERGFEVSLWDFRVINKKINLIAKYVKKFDYVFITSTTLDRWQCPNLKVDGFISFGKMFSKLCPNVFLVGFHGSVDPEFLLYKTGATGIVRGEPELTVLRICKGSKLNLIPGVSFFNNDKEIVHNERSIDLNVKKLPIPAYDLINLEKYEYSLMGNRFVLLETSRGCPYNCFFCVKSVMYGGGVREKKFSQVKKEIDYVINSGVNNIYFFDLEFSNNLKMVSQISDYLIGKSSGISWCCQMRIEKINLKLLKKMKKSGCNLIHFGIESGSAKTIKKLHKNNSKKEVKRKLRMVKGVGIRSLCFFILGFPFETSQDFKDTIRFSVNLNPTYASFHVFNPYPGTNQNFSFTENRGRLPGSCHPRFSGDDLNVWAKKATLFFYLRPSKILDLIRNDNKSLSKGLKVFYRKLLS
jgi:radical SAM superfamily enzyme YgiQ (UPF0313 family)